MSHQAPAFPAADVAEEAQLAPYRLRLLALSLDISVLLLVFFVGGLASVVVTTIGDFGPSIVSVVILALAITLAYGVMNGMLSWLTGGQTVGKAFCGLIGRRRATGPGIGDASKLARSIGRHTFGYLIIDVFGLGALTTFFLPRRRCLHDLVFDTEVLFIGGPTDRRERVRQLDDRRRKALAELKEQWGWAYQLLKWCSSIVITLVGLTIAATKALGLLSDKGTSPSTPAVTTAPPATAAPAMVKAGLVGATATASLAVPIAGFMLISTAYACDLLDVVDRDAVVLESRLVSPHNRHGADHNYDTGAASTCEESGSSLDVYRLSTNPQIYSNLVSYLQLQESSGEPHGALGLWLENAEIESIRDPRIDRGMVAVYASQDHGYGVEVPVHIVFEIDDQLVSFVGPLNGPTSWELVVDDLAVAIAG